MGQLIPLSSDMKEVKLVNEYLTMVRKPSYKGEHKACHDWRDALVPLTKAPFDTLAEMEEQVAIRASGFAQKSSSYPDNTLFVPGMPGHTAKKPSDNYSSDAGHKKNNRGSKTRRSKLRDSDSDFFSSGDSEDYDSSKISHNSAAEIFNNLAERGEKKPKDKLV